LQYWIHALQYLQLRPVLLHALHLQLVLLGLSQLPLTHCCHLRIQGALHLGRNLLLAPHILLVPICRQHAHLSVA
jgi:hypothetical protein